MFESRISALATEKLPSSNKLNISTWSYDMECRAKKCVDRCYEFAQNHSTTLKLQLLDDHQFKEEELNSVGELSTVFSHRWWLWYSVVCQQTCTCDKPNGPEAVTNFLFDWSLRWVNSWAKHRTTVQIGNCFKDTDFTRDLEDSESTSLETLCIFGSHTFVPASWMCKEQTSVSHNSTESGIIFLDVGLRMDGITALDL